MTDQRKSIEKAVSGTSRRTFLKATAATGTIAAVGGVATAQATTFELGGRISGWQGRSPSSIEGETNPTLELEAGQEYEITWENLDGAPHNVVILDAEGNTLQRTDIISEQGATQTLSFTATPEMAEYICEVHPSSMVGDVNVSGGGTTTAAEETTEEGEQEPFIPEGPSVGVQQVAEGLAAPLGLEVPEGESDRRFIVDQTGQIYIHGPDGLEDEPFLDVQDRMVDVGAATDSGFDERGLLGLAFHPDFQNNGKFYVRYSAPVEEAGDGTTTTAANETMAEETTTMAEGETTTAGEGETTAAETEAADDETATPGGEPVGNLSEYDHVFVLSEFQANDDLSAGDPDSERILLEIPEPQFNHNAGAIAFGPDDYLYVAVGDGGDADDTGLGHVEDWYTDNEGGNGQDVTENLLGSILRIDVDNEGEDGKPYAIPEDNPLVDGEGLPEQYAWGFRNPWRMSFDSEGRLFVADVGQNLYEEVDIVEMGGNYGWNVKEGTHCFSTSDPNQPPSQCPSSTPDDVRGGEPLLDPIIEYPHTYNNQPVGISVTGGYVYENDTLSELTGQYVFGDWSVSFTEPRGRMFIAAPSEDGGETTTAGSETTDGEATETEAENGTETTTGEDATGSSNLWEMQELVVAGSEDGELHRFILSFGRDADGELYALTNTTGTPSGDTGEVFKLVPEGEGDQIEAPQMTTTTEGGETTTGEGEGTTEAETTTMGEEEGTTAIEGEGNVSEEGTETTMETTEETMETTEEVAAGETPTTGQPGFGVLAALGGVASAAGYLLTRGEDEE